MQSNFNDKLAYSYPCKPTETCIDYDDYDPCESNEDITEKDLAILLKEEAAKLEREKERAKECEAESEKKAKETSDAADGQKQKPKTPANDVGAAAPALEEGEEENVVKKKICKYIKNPFFTDRLKLSTSHLPLPPPGPPPQNLPLAEDGSEDVTKICRKKKKCKKVEEEKIKKPKEKKVPAKVEEAKIEKEEEEDITEEECMEYIKCEEIVVCEDDSEPGEEEPGQEVAFKAHKKKEPKKKKCKKDMEVRPPCKKKESEVSVNFGPRKIPLQQKDLPQKSPKDIPEVENQILMACGKNQEVNCKKKCKKKEDKVK